MARYNYLDYGAVASNIEGIKSQRMQNQLGAMQLEEQQNIIAKRRQAEQIRQQFDAMPEQIQRLEAAGMYDQAQKVRDLYINQQVGSVDMLSKLRSSINADNYKQFRSDLIQSGAIDGSFMPKDYSDDWFRQQIDKKKGDLKTITRKWNSQGVTMGQDIVFQDGEVLWQGQPYDTAKKKDGEGAGGMSAAYARLIRDGAAGLYGGMWDQDTGKYIGLDRDVEKKVSAISAEAQRIFAAGDGNIVPDEAVNRAAKKLGIDVPNLSQPQADPNDPLGWNAWKQSQGGGGAPQPTPPPAPAPQGGSGLPPGGNQPPPPVRSPVPGPAPAAAQQPQFTPEQQAIMRQVGELRQAWIAGGGHMPAKQKMDKKIFDLLQPIIAQAKDIERVLPRASGQTALQLKRKLDTLNAFIKQARQ